MREICGDIAQKFGCCFPYLVRLAHKLSISIFICSVGNVSAFFFSFSSRLRQLEDPERFSLDLPLVAFVCVIPKLLRLCTRCPRTHQPSGLSVWINESGWGGILVEELEFPWVAGMFVVDIIADDVPEYSDFLGQNF